MFLVRSVKSIGSWDVAESDGSVSYDHTIIRSFSHNILETSILETYDRNKLVGTSGTKYILIARSRQDAGCGIPRQQKSKRKQKADMRHPASRHTAICSPATPTCFDHRRLIIRSFATCYWYSFHSYSFVGVHRRAVIPVKGDFLSTSSAASFFRTSRSIK